MFGAAHERRPILYSEMLTTFEDYVKKDDLPKAINNFPPEYYFRILLDSFAQMGIIERKTDDPELILFYPHPDFDLVCKQVASV